MPRAHNPPKAITIWILFSTLVVTYDAMYILLRPYTFFPNALSIFWPGHNFYATVDHLYGPSAFAENDGFPAAQSWMNLVEAAINFTYLAKCHSTSGGTGGMMAAGFMGVVMTLAKTMLFLLNEICSGGKNVAHNDLKTFVLFYAFPNGLWIAFPGWCTYWFAKEIVKGIDGRDGGKVKKRV